MAINTWAAKAVLPVAQYYLAAFAINSLGYAVGGNLGSKNQVQQYTPGTNAWAAKAVLPVGQSSLAAFAINSLGYAVGGATAPKNNVQQYTPGTNAWAAKAVLPVAQNYLAAFAINSLGYAVGGGLGSKNNVQQYVGQVTTVSGTVKDETGTLVGAGEEVYVVAKWLPGLYTDDTDAAGAFSIDIDGAADDSADDDKIAVFCWPTTAGLNGDIKVNV